MPKENALYTILKEKISQGALVLPTLPEIALQVQQAAEDPNVNLNKMAQVINHDPAMSVRMIQVANSSLLARRVKAENLNQAVTRIGLRQIKSIVIAMAMEQIYQSKSDIVTMYMKKAWASTIEVASGAITALKLYHDNHKHDTLTNETVTLAAMVHSIGVLPILTEAESHPDVFANPTFIDHAIENLSGKIGRKILTEWDFSPELIEVAEKWSDFSVVHDKPSYLDFVRLGAIKAGVIKDEAVVSALMASYVDKQLIVDANTLNSDEFVELQQNVKTMFS